MTLRYVRTIPALVLALAAGLSAPPALAQSSAADKAAAEALFDAGRRALADGHYPEACRKLEQSQALDPGIGTLLYLADCYERVGRTASAWATFRQAASQARAEGQSARAQVGTDRANKLEPKLSKLTVTVAPEDTSIDGFSLQRGKDKVERALFGVAIPVDPGQLVLQATAPGYKTWQQTVAVGADAAQVAVSVPALEKDESQPAPAPSGPPPPAPAPVAPPPAPAPSAPPEADTSSGSTQRTIGIVTGAVGVVGIGVGSYFGLAAMQKNHDAKDLCPANQCTTQDGVTLTDDARSAATASNIGFGVGAALLVGGAVLYFTAPAAHPTGAASLRLAPSVGPGGAGVSAWGAF